jgi:hypothetical protein
MRSYTLKHGRIQAKPSNNIDLKPAVVVIALHAADDRSGIL